MLINGKLILEPLASAPVTPSEGMVYYNSTTKKMQVYNGTAWEDM